MTRRRMKRRSTQRLLESSPWKLIQLNSSLLIHVAFLTQNQTSHSTLGRHLQRSLKLAAAPSLSRPTVRFRKANVTSPLSPLLPLHSPSAPSHRTHSPKLPEPPPSKSSVPMLPSNNTSKRSNSSQERVTPSIPWISLRRLPTHRLRFHPQTSHQGSSRISSNSQRQS